jgi:hypothetical protein
MILDITDGGIQWIIFVVTCSYRHCSFVASENHRYKHQAMRLRVFRNDVLVKESDM